MALTVVKTKAEEDFVANFARVKDALPGNADVSGLRQKAIERFETLGLPNRRVEEWKYTDLKAEIGEGFAPAAHDNVDQISASDLDGALGVLSGLDCIKIVFVNGAYSAALSDENSEAALCVSPVAEAFDESPSCFVENLDRVNPPDTDDAVLALNTAFMQDGALIRVEGDVAKPIQLVFVSTGADPVSIATRNVVSVASGASVSLLETFVTHGEGRALNNAVTELSVGDKAEVDHLKVQMDDVDSTCLSTWMVRLGEETQYRSFQLTSGGKLVRNQLFVRFEGEGAKINLTGAAMLRGRQHADTTIVVDHAVPHCESRELFKAILDDEARGVFQAKVIVRRHAQKTDGSQMSQALLLSETAEFDAKPELEIYADDVVCGHGATSGRIDEELLFYLRARGVPEKEARSLLIQAFVGEALEEIESEEIRALLMQVASEWLSIKQS